jgi:predicted nucleic acid-binding protein
VTTNLILIEIGDGLSRLNERHIALQLQVALRRSVTIVHVTQTVERAGWRLFSERMDKEWGVTDCISMTVAGQRDIEEVFTFDRHFEQAGFRLLPSQVSR